MAFLFFIALLCLLFSTATVTAMPTTSPIAKRRVFHSIGSQGSSRSWNPGWTWARPMSWKGSWEVGQLFMWIAIVFGCMIGGFVLIAVVFWLGGLLDNWRLKRRAKTYGEQRLANATDQEKEILARRTAAEVVRESRGRRKQRIYPPLLLGHSSQRSHIDCINTASELCRHSGHIPVLESIASSSTTDFGALSQLEGRGTAAFPTTIPITTSTTASTVPSLKPILWEYDGSRGHLPNISTIIQDVENYDSGEAVSATKGQLTKKRASSVYSENTEAVQQSVQIASQEADVGVAK